MPPTRRSCAASSRRSWARRSRPSGSSSSPRCRRRARRRSSAAPSAPRRSARTRGTCPRWRTRKCSRRSPNWRQHRVTDAGLSPIPPPRLDGKVALVTGGGRGIGRRIAAELADAGAKVAVTARTREQVEQTAAETGALALTGDVSREEDVARLVAETERELGPVDVLVNNAGISGQQVPFADE